MITKAVHPSDSKFQQDGMGDFNAQANHSDQKRPLLTNMSVFEDSMAMSPQPSSGSFKNELGKVQIKCQTKQNDFKFIKYAFLGHQERAQGSLETSNRLESSQQRETIIEFSQLSLLAGTQSSMTNLELSQDNSDAKSTQRRNQTERTDECTVSEKMKNLILTQNTTYQSMEDQESEGNLTQKQIDLKQIVVVSPDKPNEKSCEKEGQLQTDESQNATQKKIKYISESDYRMRRKSELKLKAKQSQKSEEIQVQKSKQLQKRRSPENFPARKLSESIGNSNCCRQTCHALNNQNAQIPLSQQLSFELLKKKFGSVQKKYIKQATAKNRTALQQRAHSSTRSKHTRVISDAQFLKSQASSSLAQQMNARLQQRVEVLEAELRAKDHMIEVLTQQLAGSLSATIHSSKADASTKASSKETSSQKGKNLYKTTRLRTNTVQHQTSGSLGTTKYGVIRKSQRIKSFKYINKENQACVNQGSSIEKVGIRA